ncbi:MAG: sensor histidine kinase [Bacteroidia bacterium]
MDTGKKLEMVDLREKACSCLYKAFKQLGDSKKALQFYEQNMMLKDSLFLKETVLKLSQMEYEKLMFRDSVTKEKEELLIQLAHEKEVVELEAKNAQIKTQRNGLIGGSLIAALLAFFGYRFFKIRKERNDKIAFAEALIFAQEEERKRIARDLHDGVGQSLLLIKKQLTATHNVTQENQQLISDTLEEVRSISRDLHPFQLEKFGLTAAIDEIIHRVEKSTDLFISKEMDTIDKVLTEKGEINLFRTIQEAFNNIVKHAEATAAKIRITRDAQAIMVNIQDNGKGFDHELTIVTSKSLGLRTMFERIAAIGGQLKIEKGTTKGTMILIRIPIK